MVKSQRCRNSKDLIKRSSFVLYRQDFLSNTEDVLVGRREGEQTGGGGVISGDPEFPGHLLKTFRQQPHICKSLFPGALSALWNLYANKLYSVVILNRGTQKHLISLPYRSLEIHLHCEAFVKRMTAATGHLLLNSLKRSDSILYSQSYHLSRCIRLN